MVGVQPVFPQVPLKSARPTEPSAVPAAVVRSAKERPGSEALMSYVQMCDRYLRPVDTDELFWPNDKIGGAAR